MMLGAGPGACAVCAVVHGEDMPHNAQSLPYAMKFRAEHGRDVTWADAIAHCLEPMQEAWRQQLQQGGHWTEPADGVVHAEPYRISTGAAIPMPELEPKTIKMGRGCER